MQRPARQRLGEEVTVGRITLLDGAMGAELRSRGVRVRDYKSSLWSALACVEAPREVIRLHRDYIEAGAEVITVNNYAVTPVLLAREGRDGEFAALTRKAAECAVAARDEVGRPVRVAGSLAPLNTTFAHELVGEYEENLAWYRRMVEVLDPLVDLYLCETLSTAQEARAAAVAANESGKPFMVSWTIERTGSALRNGDSFDRALEALDGLRPEAVLFNCTSCNAATTALRLLSALTDLPRGAYANPTLEEPEGGEPEHVVAAPIGPEEYATVAAEWVEAGATVLGGCCGTDPRYIAALADRFRSGS